MLNYSYDIHTAKTKHIANLENVQNEENNDHDKEAYKPQVDYLEL